ncbi:MAG TPA: hypothetical protein VGJ14_05895 [Sporichthyaceae bacterium]|jgi:hypothetical protein
MKVTWKDAPEEHDYPAAAAYLSLLLPADATDAAVTSLRAAECTARKAKDILRASGLALLPKDNPHVAADLDKVHDGKTLSPILLVQGEVRCGRPLLIADGYHRVCASYWLDENTDIPCRLGTCPELPR